MEPPPTAKNYANCFTWHILYTAISPTFTLWLPPDFVVGPTAAKAERNILGVINKVGVDIGTEVIKQRRIAQEIQALLGGHQTHVVMNIPGGVRKGLTEEQRADIEAKAKGFIDFSKFSLKIFYDIVLENKDYVDLIVNGPYSLKLYSMGLVDEKIKLISTMGK